MANTYTSIYIHLVFAVKNRYSLINPLWEKRLHSYIMSVINARGHKTIAIGGVRDHIHILLSYNVTRLIPDLVRDIKNASGKFVRENKLSPLDFHWQSGYACLSYSRSQVDAVVQYINNQHMHHRGCTLRDEITHILSRCGIEYDDKYIFESIDD